MRWQVLEIKFELVLEVVSELVPIAGFVAVHATSAASTDRIPAAGVYSSCKPSSQKPEVNAFPQPEEIFMMNAPESKQNAATSPTSNEAFVCFP